MQSDKICVYTCITGKYDTLLPPKSVSNEIEYIAFVEYIPVNPGPWKIMAVPFELNGLDPVKRQRIVKICPHRYLPKDCDTSIWVDGNIQITGDMKDFIAEYDLDKVPLYTRIHPGRNCIYDEANAVISLGKDNASIVKKQIERYRIEGYPEHAGMAETCVLLRRHNDKQCILFDDAWATELLLNSRRDQLSFNYIAWKQKFLPGYMTKQFDITHNEYFKWRRHG